MANEVHFTISIHDVSGLFWERLFRRHLAELPAIVDSITKAFAHAANQEATSDYTTGSVGLGSAVCLALLARQRKAATVVEIGTYVGRSAFALAVGMEALPDVFRSRSARRC
jgi:predicted O-methyltransferase YrrM